jgi:hypothetical protein
LTNKLTFWLGIFDDVPGDAANPSHPGTNLLWQQWFIPGQYAETTWGPGQESFLDPGLHQIIGGDSVVWYYCFNPTNPFVQTGTASAHKTYWLAAYTQLPSGSPPGSYGWKTATNVLHDTSVHTPWLGTPPTNNAGWTVNLNPIGPAGPLPLDLAFKLTTPPIPPITCTDTGGVKYEQGPNTLGGFDVWNTPNVLADDFVCTNPGPITDIHLWGSWLFDNALTNTIIFWLGIYDDVPVSPGNTFSHPGTNLLWQQWFTPGQYAETIWTNNASELFFDPGSMSIPGGDSIVWYYCFYPTNPFVQLGTATINKTYWLSEHAQLPVGINQLYGWKTTTSVLHDISVHAAWPGTPPTTNPGWTPTMLPTGGPLDLAFKLTTPTNCCPVSITHPTTTTVVVTWACGVLQSATNVLGPYVNVPLATSPYTDSSLLATNKFYRTKCN